MIAPAIANVQHRREQTRAHMPICTSIHLYQPRTPTNRMATDTRAFQPTNITTAALAQPFGQLPLWRAIRRPREPTELDSLAAQSRFRRRRSVTGIPSGPDVSTRASSPDTNPGLPWPHPMHNRGIGRCQLSHETFPKLPRTMPRSVEAEASDLPADTTNANRKLGRAPLAPPERSFQTARIRNNRSPTFSCLLHRTQHARNRRNPQDASAYSAHTLVIHPVRPHRRLASLPILHTWSMTISVQPSSLGPLTACYSGTCLLRTKCHTARTQSGMPKRAVSIRT